METIRMDSIKIGYKFATAVQFLKGVGPQLGFRLGELGLKTLEDLIQFTPKEYQYWSSVQSLQEIKGDDSFVIFARIIQVKSIRQGQPKSFELVLEDRLGSRFLVKFFRQPYHGYFDQFRCPQEVFIVGKPIYIENRVEFHHPDIFIDSGVLGEIYGDPFSDQILPLYTETTGLNSRKLHKLITQSFNLLINSPEWDSKECLPPSVLEKFQLISQKEALRILHFPRIELKNQFKNRRTSGHRRLIFEELFWREIFSRLKESAFFDLNPSNPLGAIGLRWADLEKDIDLLRDAREAAEFIIKVDPSLKQSEHQTLRRGLAF